MTRNYHHLPASQSPHLPRNNDNNNGKIVGDEQNSKLKRWPFSPIESHHRLVFVVIIIVANTWLGSKPCSLSHWQDFVSIICMYSEALACLQFGVVCTFTGGLLIMGMHRLLWGERIRGWWECGGENWIGFCLVLNWQRRCGACGIQVEWFGREVSLVGDLFNIASGESVQILETNTISERKRIMSPLRPNTTHDTASTPTALSARLHPLFQSGQENKAFPKNIPLLRHSLTFSAPRTAAGIYSISILFPSCLIFYTTSKKEAKWSQNTPATSNFGDKGLSRNGAWWGRDGEKVLLYIHLCGGAAAGRSHLILIQVRDFFIYFHYQLTDWISEQVTSSSLLWSEGNRISSPFSSLLFCSCIAPNKGNTAAALPGDKDQFPLPAAATQPVYLLVATLFMYTCTHLTLYTLHNHRVHYLQIAENMRSATNSDSRPAICHLLPGHLHFSPFELDSLVATRGRRVIIATDLILHAAMIRAWIWVSEYWVKCTCMWGYVHTYG